MAGPGVGKGAGNPREPQAGSDQDGEVPEVVGAKELRPVFP